MSDATAPAQTLDRRIRADLERRIRSGDWAPGRRIPTELDLMADYGCSRMTVSKAIAALVHLGLIERRKRAGSYVARPHVQTAVLEIPDIPALIASSGETYRFQRLTRTLRRLDLDDPAEAGLSASGAVLAVSGLHFAGDTPFAFEQRILNLAAVPEARGFPSRTSLPDHGCCITCHGPRRVTGSRRSMPMRQAPPVCRSGADRLACRWSDTRFAWANGSPLSG